MAAQEFRTQPRGLGLDVASLQTRSVDAASLFIEGLGFSRIHPALLPSRDVVPDYHARPAPPDRPIVSFESGRYLADSFRILRERQLEQQLGSGVRFFAAASGRVFSCIERFAPDCPLTAFLNQFDQNRSELPEAYLVQNREGAFALFLVLREGSCNLWWQLETAQTKRIMHELYAGDSVSVRSLGSRRLGEPQRTVEELTRAAGLPEK